MTTVIMFLLIGIGLTKLIQHAKNNPSQVMDLGMFLKKMLSKR